MLALNLSACSSPLETLLKYLKKFLINSQLGLTVIKAQVNLLKTIITRIENADIK